MLVLGPRDDFLDACVQYIGGTAGRQRSEDEEDREDGEAAGGEENMVVIAVGLQRDARAGLLGGTNAVTSKR